MHVVETIDPRLRKGNVMKKSKLERFGEYLFESGIGLMILSFFMFMLGVFVSYMNNQYLDPQDFYGIGLLVFVFSFFQFVFYMTVLRY